MQDAAHGTGTTRSLWMEVDAWPRRGTAAVEGHAGTIVIGAGIARLSTAYLPQRAGREVLVDDGPIGGGETSRTTAHLANVIDDGFTAIESLHGQEGAKAAAASHGAAIDTIESIAREEGIDCDFSGSTAT